MKIVEFNEGSLQRNLLIALIVSREVALGVAPWWTKDGLFPSQPLNLIAGWCVDFASRYDKAIGKEIRSRYEDWVQAHPDRPTAPLVEDILRALSDEYTRWSEEINVGYTLDRARKYFNRISYRRLSEQLRQAEEAGDLDRCDSLMREFRKAEEVIDQAHDLTQAESLAEAAFAERSQGIIEYPGPLGDFYGNIFARASFVTYLAPSGRGKSWALIDGAWRGMLQHRRVLFLETGDMTESQIYRRFAVRAAQRPLYPRMGAKAVRYPVSLEALGGDLYHIECELREFPEGLNAKVAMQAMRRVMERNLRSDESYFKLLCAPAGTLSVAQIQGALEDFERRGWNADCIFLDYADLLAMPYSYHDFRDKTNVLWTELRALSEKWNVCLVTATQANRESMKTNKPVAMWHSSEDIRKAAHVNAMIGISQTDAEKADGILRFNKAKVREEEFIQDRIALAASCLALANPVVRSAIPPRNEVASGDDA